MLKNIKIFKLQIIADFFGNLNSLIAILLLKNGKFGILLVCY